MSNRRRLRRPYPSSRAPSLGGLPADPTLPRRPPAAKVRSPADALAMIPYLMGFEPRESIVVVSLEGPRRAFGPMIRADVVEEHDAERLGDYLVELIDGRRLDRVLVAAFSSRPAAADLAMRRLLDGLGRLGVVVVEAVRADGLRWWSYACEGACCPSDGTPYDPSSSPLSALAVASGMGKATSREALADQFRPRSEATRRDVGAVARSVRDGADPDGTAGEQPESDELDDGSGWLAVDLLEHLLGEPRIDSTGLGLLLGAVQRPDELEAAWSMIGRDGAAAHFDVWRQVMSAAPDDLMAPAGALCAFAAWIGGHGALAAVVADRVAEADPEDPLLAVVEAAIELGVDPREWDDVRPIRPFVSSPTAPAGAEGGIAAG